MSRLRFRSCTPDSFMFLAVRLKLMGWEEAVDEAENNLVRAGPIC